MQLEGNDANSIFIPFGFDPPVHASNVSAQSKKRSPRDRFVNFDFNHQLARASAIHRDEVQERYQTPRTTALGYSPRSDYTMILHEPI